jgi:hypothetical protein
MDRCSQQVGMSNNTGVFVEAQTVVLVLLAVPKSNNGGTLTPGI